MDTNRATSNLKEELKNSSPGGNRNLIQKHFDSVAPVRDQLKKKNVYYHKYIEQFCRFIIPRGKKVIEIGSGTGDLLKAVNPSYGVGIDISPEMTKIASRKYKSLNFYTSDAENLKIQTKFDYVIMSDLIGDLGDVQKAFEELHKIGTENTRVLITYYNFLWEPFLILAEKIGWKTPEPTQNWLSSSDIQNLLYLAGFDVVKKGNLLLMPLNIPLISGLLNKYLARIPVLKNLCLVQFLVARPVSGWNSQKDFSVSVIIPARNEAGNIEDGVLRTPKLGSATEIIFVEGNSRDDTLNEIERVIRKYRGKKNISLIKQGKGIGKGDAVRKGFAKARGDILMILDADLTMPPEDLPKYYHAIRTRRGDFIMGSRLVYPMEDQAMRLLNIFGNKFFSMAFSFLLDQKIKDTLCGTKVLFKNDYEEIVRNRDYFGDFDPFGDFDLIFGAAKLNLKILEIPIRYRARTYGETNISRFRHGWLLLKMVFFASKKIKFI